MTPVIIVVVLGAGLGAYFLFQNPAQAPTYQNPTNNPENAAPAVNAPQQPASTAIPSVKPSTITVTYTDQGFSPTSVSIQKGDTVKFINQSSEPLRVGSDPHPIHNGYPTTGGCTNSTFDSCKGIQPGDSWSFTFDLVGTWGYHNHLDAREKGTVIVK